MTLYLPFDGSIKPTVAKGNGESTYLKEEQTPKFAEGLSGQGFVTGGDSEQVSLPAAGYINPDHWTISFWVKGLPGASWTWNKRQSYLETFWQLQGSSGNFMWFYHYITDSAPMLFSIKKNESSQFTLVPPLSGDEWHCWVMTWEKGKGCYIYIDGSLFSRSSGEPPGQIESITIGQQQNIKSPKESNKIIDEFKIYDGALDPEAVARQYWKEGKKYFYPVITSNFSHNKVAIDGKIDSAEWQETSGFSGMVNVADHQVEAPITRGKITHDKSNLYVALHSDDPPEALKSTGIMAQSGYLKRNVTGHDGDVESDDHFLISLSPHGSGDKTYLLRINSADVIWDGISSGAAKFDANWNSKAIAKSSFDNTGWNMEVAIPLQSLGISSISDSDKWSANFGRVWKKQIQREDLWAPMDGGTIAFGNDVSSDVKSFKIASNGEANAILSLSNLSSSEQEIDIALKIGENIIQSNNVKLPPGKEQDITLSGVSKDPNGKIATVIVRNAEKVLLSESRPVILSTVGKFNLWSYPSRKQIRIGWDLQSSQDIGNFSLKATFLHQDKVVKTWDLPRMKEARGSQLIDVAGMEPSQYDIKVEVVNGNNVVQESDLLYDKKPLPGWVGNTLGISATPPPPWDNVQVDKQSDILSISGRKYQYDHHMFPSQIVNRGKNMLTGPMRLVLSEGNQQISSNVKGVKTQWVEVNPNRATSLRTGGLGDFTVSSNSYVEFDGMNWTTLTVTPNKKQASLDGLTFEIPLDSYWAKLMTLGHDDYDLKQTGTLPKEGWKGAAETMPWIGNGDGGIQLFQESTALWKGSKTVEVLPSKSGQTLIKVHFIDVKTELDKPFEISFGWITSPTRPEAKDHRDRRFLSSDALTYFEKDNYLQKALAVNPDIKSWITWWQGWWWAPQGFKGNPDAAGSLPVPKDTVEKNAGVRDFEGIPITYSPYFRLTGRFAANNPWFEQFGDEWVPFDSKLKYNREDPMDATDVSQASRSLRDFYAWGFDQLLTKTNTQSIYYDLSPMRSDTNIYHGAGVKMEDGSIEPTFNILGMRESMKRLYTLLKQKNPHNLVIYHMSGEPMLPFGSFADEFLDGENLYAQLDRKENRGYEKILPIDKFRAEYSAQNNFGPETVFLPEFERAQSMRKDEWKDVGYGHMDYLLGLILLHDSNVSWSWMDVSHIAKIYSAIDATGLNGDWNFVPYWDQKYFSLPTGVYASLYQSPDSKKVLLVIMNTSGKDQEINLPMALGKSTFTSAKAVYPEQPLIVQKNMLPNIHVGNNSFLALEFAK